MGQKSGKHRFEGEKDEHDQEVKEKNKEEGTIETGKEKGKAKAMHKQSNFAKGILA